MERRKVCNVARHAPPNKKGMIETRKKKQKMIRENICSLTAEHVPNELKKKKAKKKITKWLELGTKIFYCILFSVCGKNDDDDDDFFLFHFIQSETVDWIRIVMS